jgi:hypothetical protein
VYLYQKKRVNGEESNTQIHKKYTEKRSSHLTSISVGIFRVSLIKGLFAQKKGYLRKPPSLKSLAQHARKYTSKYMAKYMPNCTLERI